MEYFEPCGRIELVPEEDFDARMAEIGEIMQSCRIDGKAGSFDCLGIPWEGYLVKNPRGAVVILHGFTEFPGKYREMTWYFMNMGYHVFLPVQRGHGKGGIVHSRRFDHYAHDLKFLVEDIQPHTKGLPLYLFAHSMGGGVAARYMQLHSSAFDRAVLSSPMFCPMAAGMPYYYALVGTWFMQLRGKKEKSPLFNHGFDPNTPFERANGTSRPRFFWHLARRVEEPAYQTEGASNRWVYEAVRLRKRVLRRCKCKRITTPLLIFGAGQDAQVREKAQRQFVQRVASAQYCYYPDQKHELFNATNDVLEKYLKEIFAFLEKK